MIKGIMPALAEAGKIKLGGLGEARQKRDGSGTYRLPQKYDSFLITTTRRDAAGDLIRDDGMMAELAGPDGRVTEIPVVLHSDDIEAVFPTSYTAYEGKTLLCRGDGESALRWDKGHTKQSNMTCPCPFLQAEKGTVCKPHGVLHVSIRVPGRAVAGAVHRWRTTSLISIQRMLGSLHQVLQTVGVLRGVPLVLKVEPVVVAPQGRATTVYCCHLELRARDITEVQSRALEAAERRRALASEINGDIDAQYRALVAAPGDEDAEEASEVSQEFFSSETPPPAGDTQADRVLDAVAGEGARENSLEQFMMLLNKCSTMNELKSVYVLLENLSQEDQKIARAEGRKRKSALAEAARSA